MAVQRSRDGLIGTVPRKRGATKRRQGLNFIRISVVGDESLLRMRQVLRIGAVAHSTTRIEIADGVSAATERSRPIASRATPPMTDKPFQTNGLPTPSEAVKEIGLSRGAAVRE